MIFDLAVSELILGLCVLLLERLYVPASEPIEYSHGESVLEVLLQVDDLSIHVLLCQLVQFPPDVLGLLLLGIPGLNQQLVQVSLQLGHSIGLDPDVLLQIEHLLVFLSDVLVSQL